MNHSARVIDIVEAVGVRRQNFLRELLVGDGNGKAG